ncbi:MAG TPA: metallophosphoesterase [Acidimicrobiales bacterium]
MSRWSVLAVVGVAAVLFLAGRFLVWPFVTVREDLLPGAAPDIELQPRAWEVGDDAVRFAVVGDTGTGGRNALRVGGQIAEAYRERPFGLLVHTGDLVYYGDLASRYEQVVERPFGPLLDAGVAIRPVLGNHDFDYVATMRLLERLGLPGRYYSFRSGPVEFFMLDSTPPEFGGDGGDAQLAWLAGRLEASTARWRVVVVHHPPYSSGHHGSLEAAQRRLVPVLAEHGVDIVFSGHDHHYERTTPQRGVTYVVTGGGAKRTGVSGAPFTAASADRLHFLVADVEGDRMSVEAIDDRGETFDRFTVRARS